MPGEHVIGGREELRLLSCERGQFRGQKTENHEKADFIFFLLLTRQVALYVSDLRQVAVCWFYVTPDGAPLSWGWLNICLPMGSSE